MTGKQYLEHLLEQESSARSAAARMEQRALHDGKAAGIAHVIHAGKQIDGLIASIANYRGTAALRFHEGLRTGIELGRAVMEFEKAAAANMSEVQ